MYEYTVQKKGLKITVTSREISANALGIFKVGRDKEMIDNYFYERFIEVIEMVIEHQTANSFIKNHYELEKRIVRDIQKNIKQMILPDLEKGIFYLAAATLRVS